MKQRLIDILERFCPDNVYLQGTINPEENHPETFITFWANYTSDHSHFDNDVSGWEWNFTVILYSSDPAIVNSMPIEIIRALKQGGFIPQGKGQDIPSNEPTHTGWAMEFIIIEKRSDNQ